VSGRLSLRDGVRAKVGVAGARVRLRALRLRRHCPGAGGLRILRAGCCASCCHSTMAPHSDKCSTLSGGSGSSEDALSATGYLLAEVREARAAVTALDRYLFRIKSFKDASFELVEQAHLALSRLEQVCSVAGLMQLSVLVELLGMATDRSRRNPALPLGLRSPDLSSPFLMVSVLPGCRTARCSRADPAGV